MMAKTNVQMVTLGDYIERVERINFDGTYGIDDVRGVANTKGFIKTKANLEGRNLTKFLIVHPEEFVFNRRTTRNGERLGLGFNTTDKSYILTEDYVCFRVRQDKKSVLSSWYVYLIFLCDEFDRYARWDSWGSATEFFNWENMCRVKIPLPSLEEQKKIVVAWKSLRAMKEQNEAMSEPLFALCRSRLQKMKKEYVAVELDTYIEQYDNRNINSKYGVDSLRGVTSEGKFDFSKAKTEGLNLSNYKIVSKYMFAYNPSRINLGSISLNIQNNYIISPMYIVFSLSKTGEKFFLHEFLDIYFKRTEFLRSTLFYATGSVRDIFSFNEMKRVRIPLPPLAVQKALVDIYRCAAEAKRIAEEADRLSREICPALLQHAVRGGN